MECVLSLLMNLSFFFFITGWKKENHFILSGVFLGLAALTKYVGALAAPVGHGDTAEEDLEAFAAVGRAAGDPEALAVPGLHRVRLGGPQGPGAGGGHQLAGRHHLVDQPGRHRLLRRRRLALQEVRGRAHHPQHAHQPRGAAGAGKQADQDLRQADLRAGRVGGDAPVAGKPVMDVMSMPFVDGSTISTLVLSHGTQ